ncbi:YpiF family protein [Oceanobacillus sp. FSL K6-2867]|uniref:YpiF family protein n=1 Tax=Oceanobacillus sp. FSL K6-2867 TaxID=2954748 RepID=UPI0030D8ADF0
MKWRKADLQTYFQSKEYIDTVIVPLIPFGIASDVEAEKAAIQAEMITLLSHELEKELTGRILLAPIYSYLKSADRQTEIARMNMWSAEMKEQPFKHVFMLTFDPSWKKYEQELESTLLWLPAVQTGELNSKEMQKTVREQVGQMVELIRAYWQ